MRKRNAVVLAAVLTVLLLATVAAADMPATLYGVRGGVDGSSHDESFQQYEAFVAHPLPWQWMLTDEIALATRLNGSLGTLHGGGDTGVLLAVGPGLALMLFEGRLIVDAGVMASGMTEDKYGDTDLGTHFNFISHVGITVRLAERWHAGYRFSHMSNLGLSSNNPGLNMHMLSAGYRF
jgi:opacity protein-like surface antigen